MKWIPRPALPDWVTDMRLPETLKMSNADVVDAILERRSMEKDGGTADVSERQLRYRESKAL